MHGKLLGMQCEIKRFLAFELSLTVSAHFVGFLAVSRSAPGLMRRALYFYYSQLYDHKSLPLSYFTLL